MKKTKQILWYCKVFFLQHSCQCLSNFLKSRNWAFTIFSEWTLIWSIWDCIRLKVCTTINNTQNGNGISMNNKVMLCYVIIWHCTKFRYLVPRSSRLTVHLPAWKLHFWCHRFINCKILPNLVISSRLWWIMHVLLANQKNENEIFWMNNNINMLTNFEIIS